jgi:hypothetical protein
MVARERCKRNAVARSITYDELFKKLETLATLFNLVRKKADTA